MSPRVIITHEGGDTNSSMVFEYIHSFMFVVNVEVFMMENGERGVKATRDISAGEFVCEFEANLLSETENRHAEEEYEKEGLVVYNLEVSFIA